MSIQGLYDIQEMDLGIAHRRREAAEIEAEIQDRSVLLDLERTDQSRRRHLEEIRAAQRDQELQVGQLQAKVQEVEEHMYSGQVKNPRELAGMQADVQHLRSRLSALEEDLLAVMLQGEDASRSLAEVERSLGQEKARRTQREEALRQRLQALTDQIEALESQRQSLVEGTPQQELQLYERLRTTRNGQAIARLEGGRCRGCNMAIPTHEFQRARSGRALVQCENCGRILFVG